MLKTLKYKLLFSFLALIFLNTAAFSQGITDPHFDAIKHADERTGWMKVTLRLDSVQEKAVSQINREIYSRIKEVVNKYPTGAKMLYSNLKNLEDERDERFEEVLPPGKMEKYKEEKARHPR